MGRYCNNEREHEEEGRRDFRDRGRYGYDYDRYNDQSDDCNRYYANGFDEARRENERREERRLEEQREEMEAMQRERFRRENEFFEQQQYWEQEERSQYDQTQQEHIPNNPNDDLPF